MIHFENAVVHSKRGLGCFQTLRQTGNEVCHLNPCVRELSFVKVCFYEAVEPPFSPQMIPASAYEPFIVLCFSRV